MRAYISYSFRVHDFEALKAAHAALDDDERTVHTASAEEDDAALLLDEILTAKIGPAYLEWGVDDFSCEDVPHTD